jgi:hypothetical protein
MHLGYYEPRTDLERHPVCRFQIQSLCSSKGRAKDDFYIDLVWSVDGLLTLVKSVYGILKKFQKLDESYRTLHWRLHFQGDVFTLADPETHHFHLLRYALQDGQSGWFEGSNSSFRFTVLHTHLAEICPSRIGNYPKIEVVERLRTQPANNSITTRTFTDLMKDDWLSEEQKVQAQDFNKRFREFMSGANVWNQNATGDVFRDRPKPPKWSEKEEEVILCLIQSGFKFQESWQNILRHAFVNRSEVGVAQQWYKLRRRGKERSSESLNSLTACMLIVRSKALCIEILGNHLKTGVPELGEHPQKRKIEEVSESHDSGSTEFAYSQKRRRISFSPSTMEETIAEIVDSKE